jgi:nucleotide-binding universal stress UspA family protein
MIDWKRICCAIDFEAASRVGMEGAADLARRLEAELTLVHVLVRPPPAASDVLVSSRGVVEAEAEESEEKLSAWRAEAERRAGRTVHARLLSGDAATEIVRHAREERFDLVVVGTHGRTGIPHLVLGAVAERVARQCPCPVLVVHDHAVLEHELEAEATEYR